MADTTITLEQKLESSRQTYAMLRQQVVDRYGEGMVKTPSPEVHEFSLDWTPKQGGRKLWLQVRVGVKGGLRIAFSRAAVRGISWKSSTQEGVMEMRLYDGTCIRVVDDASVPYLTAGLSPQTAMPANKTVGQLALDLVVAILMA